MSLAVLVVMTSTLRLLFVASVSGIAVLYTGSALALPHHSHDFKVGNSWSEGYGDSDRDDDRWGDKESHKFKKDGWEEHDSKKDWFTWGYGKEHEKWGHDKGTGAGAHAGARDAPPARQQPRRRGRGLAEAPTCDGTLRVSYLKAQSTSV
jgi:hypothetical protein